MAGAIECDVLVIGAGPGGYAAAFHAADHGLKTVMVDADPKPGGVCLNRGCIPSKALLHIAKLINESREAAHWGVTFSEPKIDLDKLRGFKDSVIGKLNGGISQLAGARNVQHIIARAKFTSSTSVTLTQAGAVPLTGPTEIRFKHAILATGSTPAVPPIFQLNDPRVMDSTGALELKDIPQSLLVVGGGYIGLEMGTVYAALGSKVTVVEMTDGLLPGADRDLVRPLAKRLESSFHKIHMNTKVKALKAEAGGIRAELEGEGVEPSILFSRALISIGRRPSSRDLGLETTKAVVNEKGFVVCDRKQRTNDPHILAIGDVAGEPMLAHKANREAHVAVETILGEPAEFDNAAIPAVVFTDPEIAWAGLTETQAKAQGIEVNVVRFPWGASGRAQSLDRTEGLTKFLCEPGTDRILGVGICGPGAGELISEGVLAIEMAAVARDVADSIHPHPTLSETMMESAEAIIGQATHMYRPKRDAHKPAKA
jgi:dihydrolipoamide dehydrogenase